MLPEVGSTIVPPGNEEAGALRLVDHRDRRPVLDAAARVEQLDLGHEVAAQVGTNPTETHQRRVADQVEEGIGDTTVTARP